MHERDIAEEQAFLARALAALDHMRDEARYLRDQAAVAHMNEAGDLVQRDVVMNTAVLTGMWGIRNRVRKKSARHLISHSTIIFAVMALSRRLIG